MNGLLVVLSLIGFAIATPAAAVAAADPPSTATSRPGSLDLDGPQTAAAIGTISSYAPTINVPRDVVYGPDGNLWLTDFDAITKVTPAGIATRYAPSSLERPRAIVSGPDGALWFADAGASTVGRITTSGVVTTFADPGFEAPVDIALGADGNLWVANQDGNTISRVTTTGSVTTFALENHPKFITAGPDGNLWVITQGCPYSSNFCGGTEQIDKVSTAGVKLDGYFPTFSDFYPTGGIELGADGNLWFSARSFDGGLHGSMVKISTSGMMTGYTDAGLPDAPGALASGPDGNLWFTNATSVGRVTPAGAITIFPAGSPRLAAGIASGGGKLWVTDYRSNSVLSVNTDGSASVVHSSPSVLGPQAITAGADGNLWFTNFDGNSIGRVTPAGVISTFSSGSISGPSAITAGPDGNLWFTNFDGNSIGRVTPAGVISTFSSGSISGPSAITAGPNGNLWFTNFTGGSIGQITPTGVVSSFTAGGVTHPSSIATGPDGNLWFTNPSGGSVGRVTSAGQISIFADDAFSYPQYITAGPDGRLWVADGFQLVAVTTSGVVSVVPLSGHLWGAITGIVNAPDGNLWATFGQIGPSNTTNSVAKISISGATTPFTANSLAEPASPVLGPDGGIWFVNQSSNTIGRVQMASIPGAPSSPSGVAGDGEVTVSWSAPVSDGGLPISSYTVTASPGGGTCSWSSGPLSCVVTGLSNGTPYTFTVHASNAVGDGPESAPSSAVVPSAGFVFHAVSPVRVLDSRAAFQVGPYSTPWGPGTDRAVQVAGVGGVPGGADAVVLNVTVTNTTAPSFLTIYPNGESKPLASSLNWTSGVTIPNSVTAKVGSAGSVRAFSPSGNVDVIVDVVGYYDSTGSAGFESLQPARVLDSRAAFQVGPYSTPWGGGTDRAIQVAGVGGVPADADAVVLNTTVTNTTAPSFLTIYPNGETKPLASSLNWAAGWTIPNSVTVKVGTSGKIRAFNPSGNVDVIVDVVGYYKDGAGYAFHPATPVRIQDSRAAFQVGPYSTPWGPGTDRTVQASGANGIPSIATAVLLNTTVTNTSAASFLTIYPNGQTKPLASSLNWAAGWTIPNAVTAKTGTASNIRVYNPTGTVDVIIDAAGWFG